MIQRVENVLKAAKTIKNVFYIDSENILHVSLKELTRNSGCTCICAIGCKIEHLECFARDLIDLFETVSVIIHDEYRPKNTIHTINIPSGMQGHIRELRRSVDFCTIHPVIEGILDWKHENETQDFL